MHILLFLAAMAAAAIIYPFWRAKKRKTEPPDVPEKQAPARQWDIPAGELAEVIDALRAVMEHPRLGGPGFLSIQFSAAGLTVTAQFPNISEELYRRIALGELEDLPALGVPDALFGHAPVFEMESGGMVLISAEIRNAEPLPEGLRERGEVLEAISLELRRRYPEMTVHRLGGDILLTPVREERVGQGP